MRVLQVGNEVVSAKGGTPLAIRDVQRAVGGDIVSFTSPGQLPEPTEGVLHVPKAASWAGRRYGWASPGAESQARERFDRCSVVLIHGFFRHHYGWAVRQARQRALPHVIVPHGSLDAEVFAYRGLQKTVWWKLVGQPGLRDAAGVVFMTQRERDKAARLAQLPQRQHVVHLPVAVAPLDDAAALRDRTRRRLGIDATHRVLLFLGRFDPIKRLHTIIAAFNQAARPDLHLLIAGPDTAELTAAECARGVGEQVRPRVHFQGAVYGEDKRALFAAADAFVNVSTKENFGYSLCEALAAGLPAIVGPGNDLGPELDRAGCAWLLSSNGEATVARAYADLAHAPAATLQAMGLKGRGWVKEHLAFEAFRSSLQQICAGAAS